MFFNNWLQRKLASVLHPWLRQDSELELKLGFLRSHGTAKNLCFDSAVLSQQLDHSSRFAFTDFRIDELKLGVSNWSFPAFRIDVDGLHVTLTLRDVRYEDRVNQRQQTADRSTDHMKKVLSEIDPEGIALNDAMESLSAIICSKNRRTSILCTILGHCHLRIRHVHLLVQCPTSNNSYSCMLEINDFDIKSGFTGQRFFLRAVISSLLSPSTENSFKLGVRGFTVGLKDKDSIDNIFSSRYLQTSIALKDLRLVNFNLSNPQLEFTISPAQIFMIAAMSKLSATESLCARNGRQLWSIAASRYNSLLPVRRWSFQKLVNVVCLWLRYIHAYEHLLSSVGYPIDKMMKRSVIMMSHDKQFSISVKQKWNEISAIEKDLPLEAAVLARRLVRCRVASSVNQSKDISFESLDNRHTSFIWKILNLLVIIWSYICSTYDSIILFALPQIHYLDHMNIDGQGIASNNVFLQHCFSVNIGIISITIYPEKAVERSVSGRGKSNTGISYSNLLSFCFSVDTFYFLYKEHIFDRSLSFSCGNLNATSSSVMIDSSNNYDSYLKGRKKKSSDPVLTLWGQPAQVFDDAEADSFPFVGGQVKEMWSTWKASCAELEDAKVLFLEHPFIFCKIKNFLTDQGFRDKTYGFKNCCLVIGELNLILDYASIVSIVTILKQIQSALYRSDCSLEANVRLNSPVTCEDQTLRSWDNKYNLCASEMEIELYKLLPHQHIQAAVFIAGPQIRISLKKEDLSVDEAHVNSMHDDICLVFNIRSVELGVKPTLVSDLESSFWGHSIQDELPACLRLKEPELTYSSLSGERNCKCQARSTLDAHLKVNGLIAYLDTKNREDQIIVLNPTTIRLSSIRKELHSFGATIVAFSAGMHWVTTELAVLIFMDEISVLAKVVDGLTSFYKSTVTLFDSNGYMNLDGSGREETVQGHSGNTGTSVSRVNWGNLIESSTAFVINCTCEIKTIDIVLHKSRESNYKDHTSDTLVNNKLTMLEVLDHGVSISIKESRIGISYVARDADIMASFSVLRAGIFNFVSDVLGNSDQFCLGNLLLHSMNCKKELSFSDCTFALWLRCLAGDSACEHIQSLIDASDCDSEVLNLVEESPMATENEGSITFPSNISQKFSGTRQNIGPASSHRILVNISLSEIYFAGSLVKDLLFGEHDLNKLKLSLSIGENCRRISCLTQGGSIFLEAEAAAMFFQCLTSYEQCFRQVMPAAPLTKESLRAGTVKDVVVHNNHHSEGLQITHPNVNQDKLVIGLSEISLVLVARDELGILQEILFELDAHLDVEMTERKKFLLRLSQFSIISHTLHESIEQQFSEIQISQSSSEMSNLPSSLAVIGNTTKTIAEDPTIPIIGDPTTAFQQMRGVHSAFDEAGSSGRSISPIESYIDTTRPKVSGLSPQNCILKHLSASLALEKFVPRNISSQQYWVGGGSISGFEMTISLKEIQIILSTMETMSGFLSKKRTNNAEQKYLTRNQEPERNFEDVVPDGTVVALQDAHHHTYITVEGGQNNYNVVGSIHYSVVGDRALFRVKYYYQRRWGSSALWVSLTSLYAKTDSGEPLRLNCRAGSSFVDISSSSDSAWALWNICPFKAVNYYGDTEVDLYNPVATNMFHLINRKNDRGIAFIDDSLECVGKPGNPFKLKVFQDHVLARDIYVPDTFPVEALETGIKEGSERTENQTCISIEVDKLIVTIVHEISTTKEKIPLLQLSIVSQGLLMQILHNKARIMSRLNVVLYYFDAQRNLWSELLHPSELSLFYRYRFQIAGTETILPTVPVHFYAKIKQLDISMTELSLDILLFVIGELNLAGPFTVRSSVIFANCCKVENQSGLTLLCHFHENQYASVARNQSSMVFLRHLALASQTSNASIVTVQLTDQGSFTTSPLHISLLEARTFAWRTRIVSSQEPKTYPGPFIVAEVSRRRGDGLSLVVSPLLRIHNETDFSMELRFQRPEHKESESASVILKVGDTIDDTLAAFSAINLSGGSKKALVSLSVGNYLFSFRPEITKDLRSLNKLHSVEWSNDLKGGKAVYLSGIFDKLGYKVRKALSTESVKCSFSIAHCSLNSEEGHMGDIDFLIQSIGRDIPVIQPDNTGYTSGNRVALQEQKEIFMLPTIRISNLLQSEVEVFLSDKDSQSITSRDKIGKFAIVPCGTTANLYANPATIYFTFTLTAYNSSCKPVNCADWVKKLQKQKSDVNSLDIELDFGSGKYFAFLRLSFKDNGILEAAIFTSYTLKNETEFLLFCCGPNQKALSRYEAGMLDSEIPPELGSFLPAKSTSSWFIKCNKVRLILLDRNESHTILDLDALSGLTEIDLEVEEGHGCKFITKLGVALKPSTGSVIVPSRTVSINPRYIVSNESEETINVRQCYLEDEMQGVVTVSGKQRKAVHLRNVTDIRKEIGVFDKILRHHKSARDDSLLYVQFKPKDGGFDWSGPVCVTSLGRFFLKFKRFKDDLVQDISNHAATLDHEYSSVNVREEGSTLVLHFYRPPHTSLPYRIENCLEDAPITYYQKGSSEPGVIGAGGTIDYVWDDSNLPHKLVIQISEVQLLREINLDKLRAWKPFYRAGKQRGLGLQLPLHRNPGHKRRSSFGQLNGIDIITSGFEVYADGPTRVLRICEFPDSHKANTSLYSGAKMQLRVFDSAISILEPSKKKERETNELPTYTPIIVIRLGNIYMDSLLTNHRKCNSIRVQSLSVDEKWIGAPFASMIRRHHSQYSDTDSSMLHVVFILLSTSSEVKHVEYSSIVFQPFDLNLDEETLMRIVPFWRASLSDPHTKSQQYYFDHFEIHPIKIIASFLPGEFYSSYSSTQETLRTLLHSVIQIPAIKHKSVELNGVLVTHAMITIRELSIKCAQHYSWYAMRAIYIAKGSPLLPPAFASIFDDSASSSLDVFFDPSSGLINIPGLTIGTFKLISKSIDSKGFSGTKRYFGDLGKTLKAAGSNVLFAAATEISDSILKGAETNGFNGMVTGFHQGVLKLAMEPTLLGTAFIEGGPDRKIKLDRNPGVDELYIEGYLQAMLDAMYKQEYLRVRVIDDQVILKNLPPSSSLIEEIMDRVKGYLVSKTLLKGDSSSYRPLRHIRGETDWKIGPTILTLCEHLFVSFMIRGLRKQAGKVTTKIKLKEKLEVIDGKPIVTASVGQEQKGKGKVMWRLGIGRFVLSGIIAYLDGRLCRCIPNPIARRIVSGFLLTFLDQNDQK